jgi:hypothetical protein
LWRRGFLSKGVNPREILGWSPKERASIIMKWGITPKIAPSLKRGALYIWSAHYARSARG